MPSLLTDIMHSPQSNHVPNANKIATNFFIKTELHSVKRNNPTAVLSYKLYWRDKLLTRHNETRISLRIHEGKKHVFFMSSTNLRHILISFCDSFQSCIDLVAWEAVTGSYMTAWIKLGFDKMWTIRMIFCLLANKHLSKTISIWYLSAYLSFSSFLSSVLPFHLPSFLPSSLFFPHFFFLSFFPYYLLIYFDFEVVSKTLQIFSHRDRTVSNFHRNSRKKNNMKLQQPLWLVGNFLYSSPYIYNPLFMCYWNKENFCSS